MSPTLSHPAPAPAPAASASASHAPALTEATPIYYGILTDHGQALLADAIASGTLLPLTAMAVGDGAGQPVTPLPEMVALTNEVYRAPLNQLFVDPTTPNQIVAEMVMGETIGGFWIRELGLYDETGTLFAVANAPASYKPILDEGAGRALLTRMVLIVSDTSAVELILNPDTVMASKAYVDAKIAEHAASRDHPAAIEGAQGMIPLATQAMVDEGTDHTSALTPKTAGNTFAKAQHEHEIDDVQGLQEALDEKSEEGHTHTHDEVGAAPAGYGLGEQTGRSLSDKSCNEAVEAGWYSVYSGTTDTPQGQGPSGARMMVTTWNSGSHVSQLFFGYESNRMWVRSSLYDDVTQTMTWKPWTEVYTHEAPPTASDIGGLDEVLDGKLNKAGDIATGNLTAPKFIMNAAQGTEAGDAVRYDFLDTQIPKRPGLCQSNLNSHTTAGIFHQSSDSTAANGQNYPAPYKGTLLVFANGGGSLQIYSTWSTMGWQFRRIYYRTQFQGSFSSWLEVYDTGNPPTPDEIGAAPASHTHTPAEIGAAPASHTHPPADVGAAPVLHTHTAAQGNQDVVAGGYGQVGTYVLAWNSDGQSVFIGNTKPGSVLIPATAGERREDGTFLSGTYKCLGHVFGGGNADDATTLWIRIA